MKIKDILNEDKITKAVDKANEILNPLGLCVGELAYTSNKEIAKRNYNVAYFEGKAKLVTQETIKKLEGLDNEDN